MITATDALALSGVDSLSNKDWFEYAKSEITEIIRKQAITGNILFILSKRKDYCPTSIYAIFDDYSKMELLCAELSNNGFFVKFDNNTLKIHCKHPFPVPKAALPLKEHITKALSDFKKRKAAGT